MASQQVSQVPCGGQAQAEGEQKPQEGVSWAARVKGTAEKAPAEGKTTSERRSTTEQEKAKAAGEHQAAASAKREEAKKEAQQAGSQVTETATKAAEGTKEKGYEMKEKAKEGVMTGTEKATEKTEELKERAKEGLGETAETVEASFGKGQEEVQKERRLLAKGWRLKGRRRLLFFKRLPSGWDSWQRL
ncbi:hypothetical protein CLOM_g21709 [Closterium sp. NIES-68]|nr:hypothetical protein CLOM_g21709 [Closterium sp. NIES-68]